MPASYSSTVTSIAFMAASTAIGIAALSPSRPARPLAATNVVGPLSLTRISEVRAVDVVKPADEDGMFFMGSDQPALTLTFAMQVPAGTQVMSVGQPKTITAVDSAGTDLSKIKPGFDDELEYIELEHDFVDDDDASTITLKLLPTARRAETFNVQATFDAIVFTGFKPVKLDAAAQWSAVPADAISDFGQPVRLRVTDEGVEIEPASIEEWLEKIEVQIDPNEVSEGNGWFSDSRTITYLFDDMPETRPLKLTLTLRTGVNTIPLTIDVQNQPLP